MRLEPVMTMNEEEIIIPGLAEIIGDNWILESEVDFSSLEGYRIIWEQSENGKWRTIFKKYKDVKPNER